MDYRDIHRAVSESREQNYDTIDDHQYPDPIMHHRRRWSSGILNLPIFEGTVLQVSFLLSFSWDSRKVVSNTVHPQFAVLITKN